MICPILIIDQEAPILKKLNLLLDGERRLTIRNFR